MTARDRFHQVVRESLIREGWTITADPLLVEFAGLDINVDLRAEKLIAEEKGNADLILSVASGWIVFWR